MQDVESPEPFVTGDDISGGVTFGVADVQPRAAGIREHVEHVILWLRRIEIFLTRIRCVKTLLLVPNLLPFGLDRIEWIWFSPLAHESRRSSANQVIRKAGIYEFFCCGGLLAAPLCENYGATSRPSLQCKPVILTVATRNS